MKDAEKTKEQLIDELGQLRQRIAELEASEAERSKVEDMLREGEKRYRDTLDNMMEGCQIIGFDWRYLYLNDVAASYGQRLKEELLGQTMMELYPGIEKTEMFAQLRSCIEKRTPHRMENEFVFPDGSRGCFELSMEPVPEGVLILSRDVTERKKMEEALEESELWYRHVFDNAPFGIGFASIDGKVITLNKAMETITGYSIEDFNKINLTDTYVNKVDRETLLREIRRHGGVTDYPVQLRRKDDTQYDALLSVRLTTIGEREFVQTICQDVTARKKAEEALRESEEKFRAFFEDAPAYCYIVSPEGKILDINKLALKVLGYTSEEVIGKPLNTTIYAPDSRRKGRRLFKKWQETGKVENEELKIITKEGAERTVLMSADAVRDAEGKLLHSISMQRDITERKAREEEYQTIIHTAIDGFVIVDMQGHFLDVNEAYCGIIGYSRDELLNMVVPDVEAVEKPEEIAGHIQRVIEAGYERFETRQRHKDGALVDIAVSVKYVPTGGGRMFAFYRDITKRKQAEKALQESEEKFRLLTEKSVVGIYIIQDSKMAYVNPSLAKIFGYEPEEIIGLLTLADLIHPDDIGIVIKRVGERLAGRVEDRNISYKAIKKDGSVIHIEVYGMLVDYKGKPGVMGTLIDVTERKRAEEALRLSEQNFRDSIESSPLGVRIVSDDGETLYANRALLAIYGYSSLEELVSVPTKQRYPPESYAEHRKRVEKRKRGEYVPPNYEISIVRKDGQVRELAVSRGEVLWDGKRQFQVLYQDITERKQAEEEYKTIIRTAMDGFWLTDMHGRFLDVNEAYCNLIGYSREELLNRSIQDVEAVEKPEEVVKRIRKIKEVGYDRFESHHRCKEGEIIDVEVSVNYLPVHGGRLFVSVRDVTERKRAEEALSIKQAELQIILDSAPSLIFYKDKDNRFIRVNKALAELIGLSKEQVEGRTAYELFPQDAELYWQGDLEVINSGQPKLNIVEPLHVATGVRWVRTDKIPYRNDKGEIMGIIGFSEDITEHKRAEEALRASEARYRLLAENVRDVIWAMDMDLRFTYVSPSVKYLGDRTAEEVIAMSLGELLTPSAQELAMKTFAEELVIANATPFDLTRSRTLEVELLRSDGSTLWAELKMNFMRDPAGRPVGILGVMRDISERKRAEEERRALEQKALLASHLASVGELSAGVAHEINNPLTGVIGYAELLLQEDIPEHIRNDLEIIHDGAKRVADIVKGLLTFARQTRPERTVVDINRVIQVALRLRAYELETGNIRVVTKLDPDLPVTVADAGQLQQVFLNLIMNAETEMKSAHAKGKLVIRSERMDDIIRISFKDDGPGIAEEHLERIFDPFFTTREIGRGTGLGLSICHGIVTEHGGRIWAESQLGRGATFIMELPVVTEERYPRQGTPAHKPKKTTKGKILVVDDEPVVRSLLSQVLTEEGHEVETTDDGKDALNRIKDNRYSLILLDMKLPGISGSELYERIQEIAESLAQRVVFITGDVMGADTEAFLARTKVPYITKPFDVKQLSAEIKRLLSRPHPRRTVKPRGPKVKS